ncbi:MAG: terminase [Alphaproteobacteria bacterium]|nr:terminase [Alphaproteobacteria bacterium]
MAVQRWTSRRRAAFLTALAETGNVSAAARAAKASRSRAYQLKAADPDFAAEWVDALETAIDALDAEARRRALDGVETPHFHQGRVCGTVRKYSDTLLMFLLRAHRPARYRERPMAGSESDVDSEAALAGARDTLAARLACLDDEPEPDEPPEDPE